VIHAAEQERPDVRERRAWWQATMLDLDPRRLVFLDETAANTKMTRLYGRARRGQRVVGRAPHGHWKTTTFLAALRHDGLSAPLVVDGPMNADVFLAYVQQHLAPTLSEGDVVIMDNLAAHKRAGVREAIAARGASLVYLPPYSPDFNPIEQVFAKVKSLLRKLEARTIPLLESALGTMLDHFAPAECTNYFRHCGYATGK